MISAFVDSQLCRNEMINCAEMKSLVQVLFSRYTNQSKHGLHFVWFHYAAPWKQRRRKVPRTNLVKDQLKWSFEQVEESIAIKKSTRIENEHGNKFKRKRRRKKFRTICVLDKVFDCGKRAREGLARASLDTKKKRKRRSAICCCAKARRFIM